MVRLLFAIFYADDAYIAARCPKLLQTAFDALIKLFERVRLRTNTSKTKVKTRVPGKIRTRLLVTPYHNIQDGLRGRHKGQDVLVDCNLCGISILKSYLPQHRETQHKIYQSLVINKDLILERRHVTYRAGTTAYGKLYCPVPGCVGGSY